MHGPLELQIEKSINKNENITHWYAYSKSIMSIDIDAFANHNHFAQMDKETPKW